MQFYVMTRTHVRQFTLLHVAKCHSKISWIMYSYFPTTGFRATVYASTVDYQYDCAPTRVSMEPLWAIEIRSIKTVVMISKLTLNLCTLHYRYWWSLALWLVHYHNQKRAIIKWCQMESNAQLPWYLLPSTGGLSFLNHQILVCWLLDIVWT